MNNNNVNNVPNMGQNMGNQQPMQPQAGQPVPPVSPVSMPVQQPVAPAPMQPQGGVPPVSPVTLPPQPPVTPVQPQPMSPNPPYGGPNAGYPNYPQMNSASTPESPEPKKNTKGLIIGIVVAVLVVAVVIVAAILLLPKKDENKDVSNSNSSGQSSSSNSINSSSNVPSSVSNSNSNVNSNGNTLVCTMEEDGQTADVTVDFKNGLATKVTIDMDVEASSNEEAQAVKEQLDPMFSQTYTGTGISFSTTVVGSKVMVKIVMDIANMDEATMQDMFGTTEAVLTYADAKSSFESEGYTCR